jgi:hypothetical protein
MFKRFCPRDDGNKFTFRKMYKTYILSILENCNLGFYTKIAKYYLNYKQRFKYFKLNTLQNTKLIPGLNILKRIKHSDLY